MASGQPCRSTSEWKRGGALSASTLLKGRNEQTMDFSDRTNSRYFFMLYSLGHIFKATELSHFYFGFSLSAQYHARLKKIASVPYL